MTGGLFGNLWERLRPVLLGQPAVARPVRPVRPARSVRKARPVRPAAGVQAEQQADGMRGAEGEGLLFDLKPVPRQGVNGHGQVSPPTAASTKQPAASAATAATAPAMRKQPPRRGKVVPAAGGEHASPLAAEPIAATGSMQERYDTVVRVMLARYGIKVRKWRTSMSGIARLSVYKDGTVLRTLESPRPKGPMSMAVFLHEIGHHAIGFDVYKPRCLEEYHAWRWSLEAMAHNNLPITDSVRYRMARSLHYAVAKAWRRGIKGVPPELAPYLERPTKPEKGGKARGGEGGREG
jgi:hypothetical protein